ncbi:hypothetical protein [Candidatus Stoquefichus sp. SB1]|uniref:Uncharacterized protein n=1 Tax=Siphoviridae sp. ctQtc11 TaxID=2825497 RepID=A0A8S5P4V4_9CAUD|nr:hypothetical protein [Candidatus Stoquefichus sp. SB1]DAE01467.1 MAG TPA: hypothetical protein [Siphoviridae sp. ctQtc11]
MKKTKARFYTAILNRETGRVLKKVVDGYLFYYEDMSFGIYKRCDDAYIQKYVVIDIETGLKVLGARDFKMIDICMYYIYNNIKNFYKTNNYNKHLKSWMSSEICKDSTLSMYHWKNNFLDLTGGCKK